MYLYLRRDLISIWDLNGSMLNNLFIFIGNGIDPDLSIISSITITDRISHIQEIGMFNGINVKIGCNNSTIHIHIKIIKSNLGEDFMEGLVEYVEGSRCLD